MQFHIELNHRDIHSFTEVQVKWKVQLEIGVNTLKPLGGQGVVTVVARHITLVEAFPDASLCLASWSGYHLLEQLFDTLHNELHFLGLLFNTLQSGLTLSGH